jgi:hypothetical protein
MGKKNPTHVLAVHMMMEWLRGVFAVVLQEAPMGVAPEDNPTNEPEPDMIVSKRSASQFRTVKPRPEDLQLVVEVSDTTLSFDLTRRPASMPGPASSNTGSWISAAGA